MQCLNCGDTVEKVYCPSCGQSAKLGRYNLKYIGQRFLDSLDLEKGFLFTIKVLLIRPGQAIRNYVDGKRIGFYNPIKLLLITGTIATFLFAFGTEAKEIVSGPLKFLNLPDHAGYNNYSRRYFSFFTITAIPFFALFSWALFYRSGLNYWENLVMNVYVAVGQFLIVFMFVPFKLIVPAPPLSLIYGFINFSYNVWALTFFFKVNNTKGFILAFLAVALPQMGAFFYNYLIYRLAPSGLWDYLDTFFSI